MRIAHRVKRLLGVSLAGAMVLALMPAGIAAADEHVISTDGVAACEGSEGLVEFNDNLGFFASEVECMAAFGITLGDAEGNYDSTGTVTRQQMALFIARLASQAMQGDIDSIPEATENAFDDIADINPPEARDAINWLSALEITTGVTDDIYDPSGPVTRQQMASFIARAHVALGVNFSGVEVDDERFTDVPADNVHADNINLLAAAGVVAGIGDGTTYSPTAPVTRGQMSAFIVRSIGVLESQGLWNGQFVVDPDDTLSVTLSWQNEVNPNGDDPVDADDPTQFGWGQEGAEGVASFNIDDDGLSFELEVNGLESPPFAIAGSPVHIHEAGFDANGPVVVVLGSEADFEYDAETQTLTGAGVGVINEAEADANIFAEIQAEPGDYYVNVHSEDVPSGAVRGQLPDGGQDLLPAGIVQQPQPDENAGQVVAFNTQVNTDGAGNEYLITEFEIQAADYTPAPTADVGAYVFVSETDDIVTVTYDSGDSFVIDGATVSRAVFNATVRAGDGVEFAEGDASNTHTLTTDTVVEGQVGNVAINTDVFVFLNPVTGTIVGGFDSEVDSNAVRTVDAEFANGDPLTDYNTTRSLFSVDGSNVGLAEFEENISEGDEISVSGTTDVLFELTNAEISGTVTGFVDRVAPPPGADATFQIESEVTPFGSDFRMAQKVDFVVDESSVVATNAVDTDADDAAFFVDGDRVTLEAFVDAMNDGDDVSYERSDDFETFTLVNRAPAAIEGIVVDSTGTDGVAFSTTGTGTNNFAVYANGSVTVIDFDNPTVSINGITSTITEFGDVVRAGGEVVYQAGDADTGTSETLTYTTANVSGSVGTVNTGGTAYDVVADDGATVLIVVNYTTGANTYQVDGAAAAQAGFETALDAAEDDEASVITVVPDEDETDYNDGPGEYQHQLATS